MLAIFQTVGLVSTVLAAVLLAVVPRNAPAPVRARRRGAATKATSYWGQGQAQGQVQVR